MAENESLNLQLGVLYHLWVFRMLSQLTFYYFTHLLYLLTNWLAYLYRRIQTPRPDVMSDRSEGIMRTAGFGFARIDRQASW